MISSSRALPNIPARSAGFTLIEVMIVVVVLAILAAVAIPSYREYIIRGNRSAAQQFMLNIANREEQYMLDARTYTATIGAGGLNLTIPADTTTRYTFAVAPSFQLDAACADVAATVGYVITATAIGPQVSDGDLKIDNLGAKCPAGKWK